MIDALANKLGELLLSPRFLEPTAGLSRTDEGDAMVRSQRKQLAGRKAEPPD